MDLNLNINIDEEVSSSSFGVGAGDCDVDVDDTDNTALKFVASQKIVSRARPAGVPSCHGTSAGSGNGTTVTATDNNGRHNGYNFSSTSRVSQSNEGTETYRHALRYNMTGAESDMYSWMLMNGDLLPPPRVGGVGFGANGQSTSQVGQMQRSRAANSFSTARENGDASMMNTNSGMRSSLGRNEVNIARGVDNYGRFSSFEGNFRDADDINGGVAFPGQSSLAGGSNYFGSRRSQMESDIGNFENNRENFGFRSVNRSNINLNAVRTASKHSNISGGSNISHVSNLSEESQNSTLDTRREGGNAEVRGSGGDKVQKKQKRLEKNREIARNCRKRKREKFEQMELRIVELEAQLKEQEMQYLTKINILQQNQRLPNQHNNIKIEGSSEAIFEPPKLETFNIKTDHSVAKGEIDNSWSSVSGPNDINDMVDVRTAGIREIEKSIVKYEAVMEKINVITATMNNNDKQTLNSDTQDVDCSLNKASTRQTRSKVKSGVVRGKTPEYSKSNGSFIKKKVSKGRNSDENNEAEGLEKLDQLEQFREELKSVESELISRILICKDLQSDFGREREQSINFHMNQLRQLLVPNQLSKMTLWSLQQEDDFYDEKTNDKVFGGGIWNTLCQEFQLSATQKQGLINMRPGIKVQRKNVAECLVILDELRTRVAKNFETLKKQMNEMMSITTPYQQGKFLLWIERNQACMHMLNNIWNTQEKQKKRKSSKLDGAESNNALEAQEADFSQSQHVSDNNVEPLTEKNPNKETIASENQKATIIPLNNELLSPKTTVEKHIENVLNMSSEHGRNGSVATGANVNGNTIMEKPATQENVELGNTSSNLDTTENKYSRKVRLERSVSQEEMKNALKAGQAMRSMLEVMQSNKN